VARRPRGDTLLVAVIALVPLPIGAAIFWGTDLDAESLYGLDALATVLLAVLWAVAARRSLAVALVAAFASMAIWFFIAIAGLFWLFTR
jgi:hypothetical protein